MNNDKLLEEAYIPSVEWEYCFIDENGLIHRPIFDMKTGIMLETGKEYYDRWVIERDKPNIVEPSDSYKISILETENKRLWDTVEYLLMVTEQIPLTGATLV